MKKYSKTDLITALQEIGLQSNDVILVTSRLFALGMMENVSTREEYLQDILESFFYVISDGGTVVVPTYTTQTASFGRSFIYEKTKCINGAFCQYVLEHPESLRSVHPINSFAALGKLKNEICLNTSASNYGLDTPLDRMLNLGAKLVIIGIDFFSSIYIHYLEATYGVPYRYNKLLDIPVIYNGKQVDRWFTANVRYLEYNIKYCLENMKSPLLEGKCVKTANIGNGQIHAVSAKDYCKVGLGLLKKNPFAFLSNMPNFEKGKIPFDGITAGRDGIVENGRCAYDYGED